MRTMAVVLLAAVVTAGCGKGDTIRHDDDEHAGPEWYEGDAEQAFLLAKQDNRPLFLYWGAEWCPPCHALKTRVFRDPRFVEKMREFVPVYLDGDTESAQILGERFGVQGFPTVILFSPDGREILRMPSDVSVERYVELLGTALERMRPIEEVLADVLERGAAASPEGDLSLLAFYSWGQDDKVRLDAEAELRTMHELYRDTPETLDLERSRFLTLYLERAAGAEQGETTSLAPAERTRLHHAVAELLRDPRLTAANLPFVFYGASDTVGLLHPEPSPARHALIETWDATLARLEQDESLSLDERLSALLPRLDLARLRVPAPAGDAVALPDALVEHVRERVGWAAERIRDDSEMQAVMSTMAGLLEEAGLTDEAEELLRDKLDETHAPYYFMGWMASLKRDADQADEALDWYRRAYDSARGRYSRFRWGSIYLRARMDLAPDDAETIEQESHEVLGELLGFDDAFAGANYSRLEQLETAFGEWNEDGSYSAELGRIRSLVHAACERYPTEGTHSQYERCQTFL